MENLLKIEASAASNIGTAHAVNTDNFFINGRYIHDYEMYSIQTTLESSASEFLFAVSDSLDDGNDNRNSSVSMAKELKKLQENLKASSWDIETKLDMLRDTGEELSNLIHSITLGTAEEVVKKPAFSGLILSGSRMGAVCIGSCKAYLLRNGILKQFTAESRKADRLIKMGIISEDQSDILIGSGDERKETRKSEVMEIQPGDIMLLCTNGVSDLLDDDVIYEILSNGEKVETIAGRLMREVSGNGGEDSATALVLKVIDAKTEVEPIKLKPKPEIKETAPRSKNGSESKKSRTLRKYVSTVISILIIALLVYAVYKLWLGNREEIPADLSLKPETSQTAGTSEASTQEETNKDTETPGDEPDTTEQTKTPGSAGTDPANTVKGQKYTVKAGDSLFKIAKMFYGDESKYTEIMKANKITNPNLIKADEVLIIPDLGQ